MIVIPHLLTAIPKSVRGCNRAMNLLVSFFFNLFIYFNFLEFMVNNEGKSDSYKYMFI